MEKNYFASLSKPAKIEYLVNFGEIINELENKDVYSSLFILNNFCVEVFLSKSTDEITGIFATDKPAVLYKYVSNLNLNALEILTK